VLTAGAVAIKSGEVQMSESGMNREHWIEVFRAAGLDEAMMRRWHVEFERRYPAGHQSFLEWIKLPAQDILKVRQFSQAG
jgi:hypothetical protein